MMKKLFPWLFVKSSKDPEFEIDIEPIFPGTTGSKSERVYITRLEDGKKIDFYSLGPLGTFFYTRRWRIRHAFRRQDKADTRSSKKIYR